MNKSLLISIIFNLIVLGNGYAQSQPPTTDSKSYSFGVVPQQSAESLAASWGPFLAYLNRETGLHLQFKTAKNIPTFEARLAKGEYDFAYMNPYHFTVFNDNPGYQAMVVRSNQPISGILVAKKGSGIQSIDDLDNKNIAFPSPAAFAASILPQAALNNANINYHPRYVSSHDSVYLAVSKGLVDAGGGVKRTLGNVPKAIQDQLTIIWNSKEHTPHAFAAHPKVDERIKSLIQKALIDMKSTQEGQEILKSLKIKHGLEKAKDSNWDDIRALNIHIIQ